MIAASLPTLEQRRLARRACGAHNNCPVELIDGAKAPSMDGESWHYETMGGRRICHPSAYSRRGWSNMRYVGSSLAVVVGRDWFAAAESLDSAAL